MPGLSCSSFASNAALGAALRCALSLSIPLPLQQVRLGGATCEDGSCVAFNASADVNTLVVPACTGQTSSSAAGRRLSSNAAPNDWSPKESVTSVAQLGPGKALQLGNFALVLVSGEAEEQQLQQRLRGRGLADNGGSASTTANVEISIPADSSGSSSSTDVQEQQQSTASNIVDGLSNAQSKATLGESSLLEDALSSSGFLDSYSTASGLNPLAAPFEVQAPTVQVPSLTPTRSRAPSSSRSPTYSPTSSHTKGVSPSISSSLSVSASPTPSAVLRVWAGAAPVAVAVGPEALIPFPAAAFKTDDQAAAGQLTLGTGPDGRRQLYRMTMTANGSLTSVAVGSPLGSLTADNGGLTSPSSSQPYAASISHHRVVVDTAGVGTRAVFLAASSSSSGDHSLWVSEEPYACDTGLIGVARGTAYGRLGDFSSSLLFAAVPPGAAASDPPVLHALPYTTFSASSICGSGGATSIASSTIALQASLALVHSPGDMKVCDGRLLFVGTSRSDGQRRLWAFMSSNLTTAPEIVGNVTFPTSASIPLIACAGTDQVIATSSDGRAVLVTVTTGLGIPIPLSGGGAYAVTSAVTMAKNRACFAADAPDTGGSVMLCASLRSRPLVAQLSLRPALARPAGGASWILPAPIGEGGSTLLLLRCTSPRAGEAQLCAVDPLDGGATLLPVLALTGAALRWDSLAVVTVEGGARIYFTGVVTSTGMQVRYLIDTSTGGGSGGTRRLWGAEQQGELLAPFSPSLTASPSPAPGQDLPRAHTGLR